MSDARPNYYKLHSDTYDTITSRLTRAQAAKLLLAIAAYYFDGTEPTERDLPSPAMALFDMLRPSLASYRRNAINGARNRQKPTQKPTQEVTQKPTQVSTQEPVEVFDIPFTPLPAKTKKVGGEGACKSACNIINHKSRITKRNSISLVTKGQPHRAAAGAAQGRPAPALPSRAEFDRICRKLEDEGLDAITDAEREAYHAGYAAYRCE